MSPSTTWRETATWTLTARWVFPVDAPPLRGGTVTIRGEQIVAVKPGGGRADHDLGNAAILPGLVNAHTHLDLSGLRGRCPADPDFTRWLRGVVAHRRALAPATVEADIRAGLAESLRYGTTLVGDISAGGASWAALADAPTRSVVFHELIGLSAARADQALADARAWLASRPASAVCRPGLSPHAPYSVRAALFTAIAGLRPAPPIAIHLAETRAELELLACQRGPFMDFLAALGAWDPAGLVADSGQVLRLFTGPAPRLFVHGNYLDPAAPVPRGATLVYCPRTHAAFGHERYPLPQFLGAGWRVALGTDSLASNPDLDVLAEARHVRRHYAELPDETILALATLEGARALGWDAATGSLTPGKSADLAVLSLEDEEGDNPYDLILRAAAPVRGVLFRGRWLFGAEA